MQEDIIELINELLSIEWGEGISMRYITDKFVSKYNLIYIDADGYMKPTEVKFK